ncbi:MAG: hypothetical protein RRZ67_04435 [Victivallaceae bacterium]
MTLFDACMTGSINVLHPALFFDVPGIPKIKQDLLDMFFWG